MQQRVGLLLKRGYVIIIVSEINTVINQVKKAERERFAPVADPARPAVRDTVSGGHDRYASQAAARCTVLYIPLHGI